MVPVWEVMVCCSNKELEAASICRLAFRFARLPGIFGPPGEEQQCEASSETYLITILGPLSHYHMKRKSTNLLISSTGII